MPSQRPTPDHKCKLNTSSFLALPHLIDCFICVKDTLPFVLSMQMMGGWDGWEWLIYIRVRGTGGGFLPYICFHFCFLFLHTFIHFN